MEPVSCFAIYFATKRLYSEAGSSNAQEIFSGLPGSRAFLPQLERVLAGNNFFVVLTSPSFFLDAIASMFLVLPFRSVFSLGWTLTALPYQPKATQLHRFPWTPLTASAWLTTECGTALWKTPRLGCVRKGHRMPTAGRLLRSIAVPSSG